MQKILFATGQQDLDNAIMSSLENAVFENVGYVDYNDVLLNRVEECKPDILVLSNYLQGSLNNLELALSIKEKFDNTRLVFLTSKEEIGSKLLKKLVIYNIYDFIADDTWLLDNIIDLIKHPVKFSKVKIYLEDVKENNVFTEKKEEGMPEFNKGVNIRKGELTDLSSVSAQNNDNDNFDLNFNEGDFIGYRPVLNPPQKILSGSSKPKMIKNDKTEKNKTVSPIFKQIDITENKEIIKKDKTKETNVSEDKDIIKKVDHKENDYSKKENTEKTNESQVTLKKTDIKDEPENKSVNLLGTNGLKIDNNNQIKVINKPKIVPSNNPVTKESLVINTKETRIEQGVKSEKDQLHKAKKPLIFINNETNDKQIDNQHEEKLIATSNENKKITDYENKNTKDTKDAIKEKNEVSTANNDNTKKYVTNTSEQVAKSVQNQEKKEVKNPENKKKQIEQTKNNIISNPINTNKKKYLYLFAATSVTTSCTSLNIAVGLSKFNNSRVLYITNRQNFAYYCCNRSRLQDKRLSKLNIFKLFNSKYSKINVDLYYVEHGADVQMLINRKEKEYDDIVMDVDLTSPYFEAYFLELIERFDYKMYILLPHDRIAIEYFKKTNAGDLTDYNYKIVIENCVEGGFSIKNISQLIGKDVLKTKSNLLKSFDDLNNQTTEFMRKDVVKNSDYEELYLDCIK